MEKIIQLITAFFTAIAAIFSSCSSNKPTESHRPPVEINVTPQTRIENTLPAQQQPPTVNVYNGSSGGYSLMPDPPFTGSQAAGQPISDPDKLLQLAVENSILIDEYLTRIDAKLKFEHDVNKSNMQKVIDWTAFIASYQLYLEQVASNNSTIQRALHHARNLDNYRRAYNELP